MYRPTIARDVADQPLPHGLHLRTALTRWYGSLNKPRIPASIRSNFHSADSLGIPPAPRRWQHTPTSSSGFTADLRTIEFEENLGHAASPGDLSWYRQVRWLGAGPSRSHLREFGSEG
ncbi:hypothetical protein FH972_022953 [Carpinus fangiana]|uniref:Uncharacterized protein n=1 Tax=Carpinus fangiana TaxID=176857 RepID=A0A5N6KUE3_9ROSI|nr:hypothetical protein FH972_022953 [Carpinus fangiana]